MKFLFIIFLVLSAHQFVNADVLLECQLSEDDILNVTISQSDGLYYQTETSKRGVDFTSEIPFDDVESQFYRLSDGKFGFRYLGMMYSEIFNEFNWFVESRGGSVYSISRAYCD